MLKKILQELVAIKKELRDIKLILKFRFLDNYKKDTEVIGDELVITRRILSDPLEELRKEDDTLRQHQMSGNDILSVHHHKLSTRSRDRTL